MGMRLLKCLLILASISGSNGVFAQIKIKGTVSENGSNEKLTGVTVLIKNTQDGVVTDLDGTFELTVPNEKSVLVISYLGMETQEIIVGKTRVFQIILNPSSSVMDEIVVVGYGTQIRSAISGAVSTVSSKDLEGVPLLRAEQAIQGKTAGVQVTQNSGSPGSTLSVRIRGTGTINDSEPLYLVDGVPVSGIDFLNPGDIATINVLKDAASAAIYGSRGANGVVVITTKTGKMAEKQYGSIQYENYFGQQQAWKKMNLLDAREYAILSNEAHIAAGKTPLSAFSNPESLGKGTDWQEAIFQVAPIQSHQLSLTGGSALSTFALSGSYFNQAGVVGGAKSGFERYTARLNISQQLKPWLKIGGNVLYTNLNRNGLPENNEFNTPLVRALNIDPVTSIRKFDGTYNYSIYVDTDLANPVNAIENQHNTWQSNRVLSSIQADFNLRKGLVFRSSFNRDETFASQSIFIPTYNLSLDPTSNDAPASERNPINTVIKNDFTWQNWQWENVLTWDFTKGKHKLNALLGSTALANSYYFLTGSNTNLPSNKVKDAFLGNTIAPRESQGSGDYASASGMLSFFTRFQYDFDNKYLLSTTLRRDGSSRFGKNNRYGYFPSVSAGWVVSREDFWGLEALNFLKLRASWGQNGNDRIGEYSYTTVVYAGQNYTFGPSETITSGSTPLEASNPDLKWETGEQINTGLDLEMFNGKFHFTADYYKKTTRDMLARIPIPTLVGLRAPFQNVGTMTNNGLELSFLLQGKKKQLNYSVGANIGFVKSEVLSLGLGGEPIITGNVFSAGNVSRTDVGHPVASFYGYRTDGIFQSLEEIKAHAFQNEKTAPGDIRFKDLNGDGIINETDQTYIGNPTPSFTYGFTSQVQWNGFDLSIFIQGTQGNDIYNGIFRYDFFYSNRPQSALNRWTGPGTSATEPRVNLNDPNKNARVSDRFIEDGSFVRLKNIQLGYDLKHKLLKKWKIDKARIYFSGQNLWTLTKYSGLDPEIGSVGGSLELGIDQGFYPQARMASLGLQLGF